MTRTTRNSSKGSGMRAVGVLVCALSIVTTLAGVASSHGKNRCDPSLCLNSTFVTTNRTFTNGTFLGAVCLKPSDKRGLKAASGTCEHAAEACCMDGELKACPTSRPFNTTSISPTTGICSSLTCPLGARLWYCKIKPGDD